MDKKELIKKVNELDDLDRATEGESLLDEYLIKHPNDIDVLIRLATYVLGPPLSYYPKAIECLEKVFELDNNNIEAHLLFACINRFHGPYYDEEALDGLNKLKTNDPEEQSMIEYAKSWSYDNLEQWDLCEQSLLKSIQLYPYNVWNYRDLGLLYIKQGRKSEGLALLSNAINNVKVIFRQNDGHESDWTSAQRYFDELIRGTHITDSVYECLEEDLLGTGPTWPSDDAE